MSDSRIIEGLVCDVARASKVLANAREKLAAAVACELTSRTACTVTCGDGYDWGEFIVRVFNVTDEQTEDVVKRMLSDIGIGDNSCVLIYSPEDTKRYYPEYYKEEKK